MIEIFDLKQYFTYRRKNGPFCLFFFNKKHDEVIDNDNLALIKAIQNLEVAYKDIPLIGFEYNKFIKYQPDKINSCLDILIIQKNENDVLFKKPELSYLSTIFDLVRKKRLDLCIKKNKDFGEKSLRLSMRMWTSYGHRKKFDSNLKCDEIRFQKQNILMGIKSTLYNISDKSMNNNTISNINESSEKNINKYWRKQTLRRIEKKNLNKDFLKNYKQFKLKDIKIAEPVRDKYLNISLKRSFSMLSPSKKYDESIDMHVRKLLNQKSKLKKIMIKDLNFKGEKSHNNNNNSENKKTAGKIINYSKIEINDNSKYKTKKNQKDYLENILYDDSLSHQLQSKINDFHFLGNSFKTNSRKNIKDVDNILNIKTKQNLRNLATISNIFNMSIKKNITFDSQNNDSNHFHSYSPNKIEFNDSSKVVYNHQDENLTTIRDITSLHNDLSNCEFYYRIGKYKYNLNSNMYSINYDPEYIFQNE